MNYLETVGKNAKKAFEDLKDVKHKKIKKVLDNYNQSLLKNSNKIIRENFHLLTNSMIVNFDKKVIFTKYILIIFCLLKSFFVTFLIFYIELSLD